MAGNQTNPGASCIPSKDRGGRGGGPFRSGSKDARNRKQRLGRTSRRLDGSGRYRGPLPAFWHAAAAGRGVETARQRLEMQTDCRGHRPRRDIMRSAEGRKEIVESLLVRQIDHRQSGAPLVLVAVKNVVVSHREVEETPRCDTGRVMVVVLRAGRRNLYERGPVLRCRAEAGRTDRSGLSRMHAPAVESRLELLSRRQTGNVHYRVGPIRPVRAIASRARHGARNGLTTATAKPAACRVRCAW